MALCLLVGLCYSESLKTKVESVLQNKDLLKLIKAFKSSRSEDGKDSESML